MKSKTIGLSETILQYLFLKEQCLHHLGCVVSVRSLALLAAVCLIWKVSHGKVCPSCLSVGTVCWASQWLGASCRRAGKGQVGQGHGQDLALWNQGFDPLGNMHISNTVKVNAYGDKLYVSLNQTIKKVRSI